MVSEQTKKDWKSMKTSELIDALDGADDNTGTIYEALSEREAWKYLLDSISENLVSIEGVQEGIDRLNRHDHKDGKVVVSI